jgi:hypothetical protein
MPPKVNNCTIKRNTNEYRTNLDVFASSLVDMLNTSSRFSFKCEILAKLNLHNLILASKHSTLSSDLIKPNFDRLANDLADKLSTQKISEEDDGDFIGLDIALQSQISNDSIVDTSVNFKNEDSDDSLDMNTEKNMFDNNKNDSLDFESLGNYTKQFIHCIKEDFDLLCD